MNLCIVMLAPWRASSRSERTLTVAIFLLAGAFAVGFAVFMREPGASRATALMMGIALGPLWLMVVPKTLLLAIDARELRLPAAQRQMVTGLWLYGVLCVVLPALILGLCGGAPAQLGATLALACSGCFAVALLPGYQMVALAAAFFLASFGNVGFGFGTTRFLYWAWLLVVVFVAVAAFNWHTALRQGHRHVPHWRQPLTSRAAGGTLASAMTAARPMADIRGCGPGAPVTSLRVALGGIHLPLLPGARIGLLLPTFLVIAGVAGFIVLRDGSGSAYRAMAHFGWSNAAFLPWLGTLVSWGIVWIATAQLQRWNQGTERQLLALLPGLNRSRSLRRSIVLAALRAPARGLAIVTAVIVAAAVGWHGSRALCLTLALVQLVLGAQLIAFTLSVLGARTTSHWAHASRAVGAGVIFVLINLSLLAVVSTGAGDALHSPPIVMLALLWTVLIAWLVWTGYRGRWALRSRPNPFASA